MSLSEKESIDNKEKLYELSDQYKILKAKLESLESERQDRKVLFQAKYLINNLKINKKEYESALNFSTLKLAVSDRNRQLAKVVKIFNSISDRTPFDVLEEDNQLDIKITNLKNEMEAIKETFFSIKEEN